MLTSCVQTGGLEMTKERIYTFEWTNENIANGVTPTVVYGPDGNAMKSTDPFINIGWADKVIFEIVTDGAAGTTFDLHVWGSEDGANLGGTVWQADVWAALAITQREFLPLTSVVPKFIKLRIDVNAFNMGAGKTTTVKVRVVRL